MLPFGISSGSEKFQKCMNQILEGLDGVECNIDDILIHATTQEEYDRRLQAVLHRLDNAQKTKLRRKNACTYGGYGGSW